MKTDLKEPCDSCPFRKVSLPSWLGPWTPWDLLMSIDADTPFPCHKTIAEDHEERGQPLEKMQSCAGAALFLANKCKLSRDPATARHQNLLRQQENYTTLKDGVFKTNVEFNDWHHPDNRAVNFDKLKKEIANA